MSYQSFKSYLLIAFFFYLAAGNEAISQMVHDGTVTIVYETRVQLTAGKRVRFETRNLSPGSDPVINLLSPEGIGVAANDNHGSDLAAQLNYLPIRTASFFLIVRSKTMETKGTADIYRDGVLMANNISFGGWQVPFSTLRAGEALQTVKLPRGSDGKHVLYILKENKIDIEKRGATLGSDIALLKLTTTIGDRTIVVGTNSQEGQLRLIRNDVGISDPDNDGLGSELETEIGTCPCRTCVASNVNCSGIDPRDTDGDGILDGWEVLGRYDMTPFQLLPKWGANPRHKDLFIEVDFMSRTGDENNATLKMDTRAAKTFAAIYGDAFTTDPVLRSYHASILKNPDGNPGISTHLDIGVDPGPNDDATIYGNWGGYSVVKSTKVDGTVCPPHTPASECRGADPNVAWKIFMKVARRGIFRYTLGYSSGGGSTPQNAFACAFNFLDQFNPPHEFGHTMGLGHSGPYNITGNVDPNCKPNYPSIMNYSFLGQPGIGFSDGDGLPDINNGSLKEWNSVSPQNTAYLDVLEKVFRYWIDRTNGHVDWNRNGIFEPANQTVKAYANYKPGGDCEFTRYNQSYIGNAQTAATPVLARLKDRLYVFYADHGSLKYRYTTNSLNCPRPEDGCNNIVWGTEKDAGMSAVGVDVMNDGNSLRVVTVQLFGKITEKRLNLIGQFENWSLPVQLPGSARGEISLSFSLTGSYLAYKGLDGFIHFNKLAAGQWQADQIARNTNNEPIKASNTSSYPAITQTFLPWKPNAKSLYGLFPDENDRLDMWCYNQATNFWEKTDLLDSPRPGPIYGKPSMAYIPYNEGMENPGRLYMVYLNKPAAGTFNGVIRMRMSYVKVNTASNGAVTKEEKIGLDSYFDNSWLTTFGISLFYESGKDTNLRSVFSVKGKGPDDYKIMFRPKADGINDFVMKNYNDWETLRKNICQRVVSGIGSSSNIVGCPEH